MGPEALRFERSTPGTHRLVRPRTTLETIEPHLGAMGITRVANVTGLDRIGIPVVMVTRPESRSVAVSQGKGITLDAAKASGLMESIEHHHAERILAPVKFASADELSRVDALADLDRLPRSSRGRFHRDLRMLWIEAEDIGAEAARRWLPLDLVHTAYVLPEAPGTGAFLATSNGLASGNHVVEATVHALCETVERDARALWWALPGADRARGQLDLESVDDPVCRSLIARIDAAGVDLEIWDATSDLGIATFICRLSDSRDEALARFGGITGAGCHPARGVALSRAITESAQVRLTLVSGARDDLADARYGAMRDHKEHVFAASRQPRGVRRRRFDEAPSLDADSLLDELEHLEGALHEAGMRSILRVDLTREEFAIPVVRVVVPGLEGMSSSSEYVPGARARRLLSR